MHLARLSPHLCQLGGITYQLRAAIHVAPTARREADSGFSPRLKDAESCEPQRRKEHGAPGAGRAYDEQHDSEEQRGAECQEAERHPLALAARTDIGNHQDASYGVFTPFTRSQSVKAPSPRIAIGTMNGIK